jgi:hypothetical protein
MSTSELERDRLAAQRGQILRYLSVCKDRRATPVMLRNHLRRYQMPVTEETMNWHLTFLEEQGYVRVSRSRVDSHSPDFIAWVELTVRGVNRVDGCDLNDDGVMI